MNLLLSYFKPVSLVASILNSKEKSAEDIFAQNSFTQQQLEEFIQEAKNGDVNAQYIVGYMYIKKKGVKASKRRAFEFYLSAANQGHMLAQFEVGCMYSVGKGVPENEREAFKFLRLAAKQGHMEAQFCVGFYFANGRGVQQDHTKAFKYYLKAANQGHIDAPCHVGISYATGEGVSQDIQKATEYLNMAEARGSKDLNFTMGWVCGNKKEDAQTMKYSLQEGSVALLSIIEKMGIQTSPSLSTTPTSASPPLASTAYIQTQPLPCKIEDWTVDDVVTWISSLNLSQSYRELIQDNHLTGKALLTMKTSKDWQDFGVKKFGDLRVLVGTPITTGGNVGSATNTHTPPAITPVQKGKLISGINSRLVQTEGLDDLVYKPLTNLLAGDFKPPHSCKEHMLTDLPNVLLAVRNIPAIVGQCVLVAESRLQHLPSHVQRLSADEALAIAAYSYDLGVVDAEVNLYHSLNTILRKRDPKKMERLKPFLFYLMSGLSKLPPLQTTVYRGIPFTSMQMIQDKYRVGVSVHWSGFTSATTDIESAQIFAQESGIIFRIKVLTGRSIKHYSSVPSEDEVLLSPNTKLLVTSNVQLESDGFYYLDFVEQRNDPTIVF